MQTHMKKVTLDVVQTAHERLLTDSGSQGGGEQEVAAGAGDEISVDAPLDSDAATVTTPAADATEGSDSKDSGDERVIMTQEDQCVHEYCESAMLKCTAFGCIVFLCSHG